MISWWLRMTLMRRDILTILSALEVFGIFEFEDHLCNGSGLCDIPADRAERRLLGALPGTVPARRLARSGASAASKLRRLVGALWVRFVDGEFRHLKSSPRWRCSARLRPVPASTKPFRSERLGAVREWCRAVSVVPICLDQRAAVTPVLAFSLAEGLSPGSRLRPPAPPRLGSARCRARSRQKSSSCSISSISQTCMSLS